MIRFFRHYVPLNLLLLVLIETLILGGSIYAGVSARFLDGSVIPPELDPLLPKALTFAVVMLGLMTASGLYDLEWQGGVRALLQRLSQLEEIELPFIESNTTRMSWFVYVIRVKAGLDRDALAKRLEARGVPVRPYFLPIHLQPYMVERFGYRKGDFPVTEDLGRRGLAVPFSGIMTEDQVEYVCNVIREEITQ